MLYRTTFAAENCGFDLAYKTLEYLYGSLDPSFEMKKGLPNWADLGVLRKYDQREFIDSDPSETGMNEWGMIYYPDSCVSGTKKCKIHVYLHGCGLTTDNFGDWSIRNNGYLELAAANDIIVAFPQTEENPFHHEAGVNDCWSHQPGAIGDLDYFGNKGLQNKALKALVERIGGKRDSGYDYTKLNISHKKCSGGRFTFEC